MNVAPGKWLYLNYTPNSRMNEAVCQLHNAVQFIAIAGKHLIPEKPDDSHTNMTWDNESLSFIGNLVEAPRPFRFLLNSRNLKLVMVNGNGREINSLHLPGVTKGFAFAWLREQVSSMGIDPRKVKNEMHYTIPEHAIQDCGNFRISDPEAFRELARHRSNTNLILKSITGKFKDRTPIAVWPHHFDTGLVINVARDNQGQLKRSIGLGYAIQDETSDEPYFYMNIWSAEDDIEMKDLPSLEKGNWITEEWKGAILKIGDLVGLETPGEQVRVTTRFFTDVINKGLDLSGAKSVRNNTPG